MRTAPKPLNKNVTKSMKGNVRKDTKPELILRKGLRDAGYSGYRLQWKVPGRPDICYPGRKIAIFVNGCFWHRCPKCNLPVPTNNREYWESKFEANKIRDADKISALESSGWTVMVVWECDLKKNLESQIERIAELILSKDDEKKRGKRKKD
ncbi:very short patch repair endonuclease [Methanomassiliicoccales archaeon LGM-RCC1]|nr:very short patch repair endonuclease [Methanomassiliicoccales archaeon LGM-RCC1]